MSAPAPLPPLLKWPGGKEAELDEVLPLVPPGVAVVEPFAGGAALSLALPDRGWIWNDRSVDLMGFYARVQAGCPAFFAALGALVAAWEALSPWVAGLAPPRVAALAAGDGAPFAAELGPLPFPEEGLPTGFVADFDAALGPALADKARRALRLQARRGPLSPEDAAGTLEAAVRGAWYTAVRAGWNARARGEPAAAPGALGPARAALFFVLRELCYASMFRHNAHGGFNVPYGGMSYNRKDLGAKLRRLRAPALVEALGRASLHSLDFDAFFDAVPLPDGALIFADPPYDSDFSTYDGAGFGADDHRRLAARLRALSRRHPVAVLVKRTPLMDELYGGGGFELRTFDKTYQWTIKARNDRRARHLLATAG